MIDLSLGEGLVHVLDQQPKVEVHQLHHLVVRARARVEVHQLHHLVRARVRVEVHKLHHLVMRARARARARARVGVRVDQPDHTMCMEG